MRTELRFTIVAFAVLGLLMAVSLAGAETIKFRQVQFITKEPFGLAEDCSDDIGFLDDSICFYFSLN